MAVKVVNDDDVCAAFEKILWVGVGQEPDVRELLGSLMKQINKQTLKPELCDKEALAEVKEAAKRLKCLLVLDDVVSQYTTQHNLAHSLHVLRTPHASNARTQWEASFGRALNVIDPDTSSKLMVTTRIRGLIQGGSEVAIGTLSQIDALKLLAATAQVDEYVPREQGKAQDDGQYNMACEVVELCGYLALTVSHQTSNSIASQKFSFFHVPTKS